MNSRLMWWKQSDSIMGTLNQALIEPRELLKASILSNAACMMLIHSHPSGNLEPSREDCKVTDRMVMLGELMGIPLLDHIIVGGQNREYFSFKERKLINNPHITLNEDYRTIDVKSILVASVREDFELEENFEIEKLGNNNFCVHSDSERFGKNAITFQGITYQECLDYIKTHGKMPKPSYYIIKDLKTWTTNDKNHSSLEKMDDLQEAIRVFQIYRQEEYNKESALRENGEPYARLTLGVKIGVIEFDLIHVKADKNYLVQDAFLAGKNTFRVNPYFIEDLKTIAGEIGLDYTTIRRDATEFEKYEAVRKRGKAQGLDDDSIQYGWESGNIPSYWIPKVIEETIPFKEWDNPYIEKSGIGQLKTEGQKDALNKFHKKNKTGKIKEEKRIQKKKESDEEHRRQHKKNNEHSVFVR